MARIIEPLTNLQCRQAKPGASGQTKLYDGGGLFLDIRKTSKKWRLKFRYDGKESTITLGDYPTLSLANARQERDEIKANLARGIHPVIHRNEQINKRIRLQNETFEVIAEEWLTFKKPNWSKDHYNSVSFFVRKDVYKFLKDVPVSNVTAQDVLAVIREIESRKAFTLSHRVLNWINMILSYAVGTGRIQFNVATGLKQFLQESAPVKHYPYVTIERLPEMLFQIHNINSLLSRYGLILQSNVFLRPNELVQAKWSEFDFDNKMWVVPANRMKGRIKQKLNGKNHLIPLSTQVITILRELHRVSGRNIYLFPSQRKGGDVPMDRSSFTDCLAKLGLQHEQSTHGFRGLASTILNESGLFNPKAIDLQLAHKPMSESSSELNYNHAQYIEERKKIMQWWSDFLEQQLNSYQKVTHHF